MAETSLKRALRSYSRAEASLVRKGMKILEDESGSFGAYVAGNLHKDRFLSDVAAVEICGLLLELASSGDLSGFRADYVEACNRNTLSGGEIGLKPYPDTLGRVVDKFSFLNKMSTLNAVTRPTIERWLAALERGRLKSGQRRGLLNLWMSQHGVWVTWDRETNGSHRPFSFLRRKSAYDLRNAMGLPIDSAAVRRLPVYGLEYASGNVTTLCRPTTADAAENIRFRVRNEPPPPDRDWYGLTVPWMDDPDKAFSADPSYPPKRPEALHDPIQFPPDVACVLYRHGAR